MQGDPGLPPEGCGGFVSHEGRANPFRPGRGRPRRARSGGTTLFPAVFTRA